jgi:hypothetical protein
MWGKCAMRLSIFGCARNVLFSHYVLWSPSATLFLTTRSSLSPFSLVTSLVVGGKRGEKSTLAKLYIQWKWKCWECPGSEDEEKSICGQVGFSILKNITEGCWSQRGVDGGSCRVCVVLRKKNQFSFQMLKQQTWVVVADGFFKFSFSHFLLSSFRSIIEWTNKAQIVIQSYILIAFKIAQRRQTQSWINKLDNSFRSSHISHFRCINLLQCVHAATAS